MKLVCKPVYAPGPDGAFYEVTDGGKHLMWVATHTYGDQPKTPAGTYTCRRGTHMIPTGERFDTFEVLEVPGHAGILFVHPGNLPQHDSDGCFLCGRSLGYVDGQRAVIISREAFNKVFTPHMAGVDEFELEVMAWT